LGIVLLSQHLETRHSTELVRSGRFGYLLKDRVFDVDDFLDAHRVAAGGSALDPEVVATAVADRPYRRDPRGEHHGQAGPPRVRRRAPPGTRGAHLARYQTRHLTEPGRGAAMIGPPGPRIHGNADTREPVLLIIHPLGTTVRRGVKPR
jgi:hypothetical protein